jgi:hypothetical protein
MDFQYKKTVATGAWVTVMLALAIVTHLASASSWAIVVAFTLIPVAVVWGLWQPQTPSMSESIQQVLR